MLDMHDFIKMQKSNQHHFLLTLTQESPNSQLT